MAAGGEGWVEEKEHIAAGKALASAPLPAWAREPERKGVHFPAGSYDAASNTLVGRSSLDVYRRQLWPETVLGLKAKPTTRGDCLRERRSARVHQR